MTQAAAHPAISVVIPAYNSAASLPKTIEAALAQTVRPHEIIVVDDGSADDTAAVAEAFGPPVRVIRKPNGGPASARNIGIREAEGSWIALLDADDQWVANKLERQLAFVSDPQVGLVHTLTTFQSAVPPDELDFEQMWDRNWIVNSTVLVRREAVLALGGFNEARELISVEDYNLWIRLAAAKWKIRLCPEPLTYYTRGVGISSDTPRFLKASLFNFRAIADALQLPKAVIDEKLASIHLEFGVGALYRRDMQEARRRLAESMRIRPRLRTGAMLAIACSPPKLLDLKRYSGQVLARRLRSSPTGLAAADLAVVDKHVEDVFTEADPAAQKALFRLLALLTIQADHTNAFNQGDVVRAAQRLAWLGYLSPAEVGRRIAGLSFQPDANGMPSLDPGREAGWDAYLGLGATLARRTSTQPPRTMGLDALEAAFRHAQPPGPPEDRARLAYHLAGLVQRQRSGSEATLADTTELLRDLCCEAEAALAPLRADTGNADALYLWQLAEEVSTANPSLWFEALLIAERLGRGTPAGEAEARAAS